MASIPESSTSGFAAARLSSTGITVVVDVQDPIIDVVFVHGFTGHPYRTWAFKGKVEGDDPPPSKRVKILGRKIDNRTSIETYWPQEFLPETIPQARVLTFGYDTKIRHDLGPEGSKQTVYDHGRELLQCLNDVRNSEVCVDRPIMFIAHSLGGIVVKEALRQSQRLSQSHSQQSLRRILTSTIGIMFFGTPHRGADPRGPLQRIIQNAIEASGFYANKHIVATLMQDSERLQELLDEFGPLARERKWAIYSFQEQYGVKALGGKKVVEAVSSCLGDNSIEVTRDIEANHMDMCRFSSINDPKYLKVVSAMKHIMNEHSKIHETHNIPNSLTNREAGRSAMDDRPINPAFPITVDDLPFDGYALDALNLSGNVQTASSDDEILVGLSSPTQEQRLSQDQRQILVESLAFREIDARWANLRAPKTNTCRWILDSWQFKEWKDLKKTSEHHGFLWIKGKPGAGKSIMMKYLFSKAKSTIRGAKVISFFFNARGVQLEHSILGLYRSLLYQLLDGDVTLQKSFDVLGYHAGHVEWSVPILKNVLAKAIEILGGKALICYIDALDECPIAEIRDMVSFFEEVGERAINSGVRFNICFSSRHYPNITIKKGLILTLENESSHTTDIENYIDSELRIDHPRQGVEIKDQIVAKASGVFLWVALVIPLLNEAFDNGKIKELRKKLHELPPKLSDLFQELLFRDSNDRPALLLCFQWVLFAKSPMKLEELYFAVQEISEDEDSFSWNREQLPREAMEKSLLSISKGLVEETKTKHPTVQFIHESVRDFLLKENGLQKLWPDLSDDFEGQSHSCLAARCVQNFETISIRSVVLTNQLSKNAAESKKVRDEIVLLYPFLEYAINNVLYHADAAQSSGITQSQFLEEFSLDTWVTGYNIIVPQMNRRYETNINLLYVLAEQDLVSLVRIHPDRLRHFDIKGGRYGTPLLAALACGNPKVSRDLGLQVFLDQDLFTDDNNQFDDFFKSLKPKRVFNPQEKTLLTSLSYFACSSAINALLIQKFHDQEVDQIERIELSRALVIASSEGFDDVVLIILGEEVDVNARDEHLGTALQAAALRGHYTTVQLLLENKVDVNTQGGDYGNALQAAASEGHDKIIQILLENGADVNAEGGLHGNALRAAAFGGHDKSVQVLLENKADVNAQGGDYGNALQAAASGGHDKIIQVLLEKGADVNTYGGLYNNALQAAASRGHDKIIQILLENGADVNAQYGDYGNALQVAISRGHEEIVRILLENMTDVTTYGGLYSNALQAARHLGHKRIVQMLLENGAKELWAQEAP